MVLTVFKSLSQRHCFDYNNNPFVAEAKMIWVKLPESLDHFSAELEKARGNAKVDVKNSYQKSYAKVGLGVVFVVPYWDNREIFPIGTEKIADMIKNENSDFLAYLILKENKVESSSGNFYNSVFMFGKCYERKEDGQQTGKT